MSATLSPRQVASVKQWLDEQPQSAKEKDEMTPVRGAHTGKHQHASHDRDFHVHSRMQQHSRMWHHDLDGDHEYDAYIDPGECFLRMCSACLASGALGVAAVTYVLVHATSPTSGSDLDNKLNWAIALPLAGVALFWQFLRLSVLAWHKSDRSNALLTIDIFAEAALGVGSVICAILAGFQAARHLAFNRTHRSSSDGAADSRRTYHDAGAEIALVVLLGLLSVTSFGILALSFVEASRRRRCGVRSTSSSVVEIIP